MNYKIIFPLFTLVFTCACADMERNENPSIVSGLERKIDSLSEENTYLKSQLNEIDLVSHSEDEIYFNREKFKSFGIENSSEYIEKQLTEHTDLIPLKALLGGTMRYTQIKVLNEKWILAHYEDGHIAGQSIYKYDLNKNGDIDFTLLDSYEP